MAAIKWKRFLNQHPQDRRIVNLVHDNILTEVPVEHVEFYKEHKDRIMAEDSNILTNVPLKVDIIDTGKWNK